MPMLPSGRNVSMSRQAITLFTLANWGPVLDALPAWATTSRGAIWMARATSAGATGSGSCCFSVCFFSLRGCSTH
jgi:hypothetical protein